MEALLEDFCAHHHYQKLLPQQGLCMGVGWGAPGWAGRGGEGKWETAVGEENPGQEAREQIWPCHLGCALAGLWAPSHQQNYRGQTGR